MGELSIFVAQELRTSIQDQTSANASFLQMRAGLPKQLNVRVGAAAGQPYPTVGDFVGAMEARRDTAENLVYFCLVYPLFCDPISLRDPYFRSLIVKNSRIRRG